MQNLIFLLKKFSYILVFLLLEFVAGYWIIKSHNYQKVFAVDVANDVSGAMYSVYDGVHSYFGLKYDNRILAEENALLRSIIESYQLESDTVALDTNFYLYKTPIHYIPCKVVNNSVVQAKNYFTVNKGENDEIREGMGVVSPSGIAGVIVNVSKNYAIGMSVLNANFSASIRLKKTRETGSLEWPAHYSPKTAKVIDIPSYVKITIGDTIETSGYSSLFPEGTMVGTIRNFEINPDDGYYMIDIDLSTDFHALQHVYLIDNKNKAEKDSLEKLNYVNERK